jgi:hypothetical protein
MCRKPPRDSCAEGWCNPVSPFWPADRTRSGFEAFHRDAQAIVVAVGKRETAFFRNGIDAPPRRRQLRLLRNHSGSKVRPSRQHAVFQRPAQPIAHDQPARFATDLQSIGSTASCDHPGSMAQRAVSSANPIRHYWMRHAGRCCTAQILMGIYRDGAAGAPAGAAHVNEPAPATFVAESLDVIEASHSGRVARGPVAPASRSAGHRMQRGPCYWTGSKI